MEKERTVCCFVAPFYSLKLARQLLLPSSCGVVNCVVRLLLLLFWQAVYRCSDKGGNTSGACLFHRSISIPLESGSGDLCRICQVPSICMYCTRVCACGGSSQLNMDGFLFCFSFSSSWALILVAEESGLIF